MTTRPPPPIYSQVPLGEWVTVLLKLYVAHAIALCILAVIGGLLLGGVVLVLTLIGSAAVVAS